MFNILFFRFLKLRPRAFHNVKLNTLKQDNGYLVQRLLLSTASKGQEKQVNQQRHLVTNHPTLNLVVEVNKISPWQLVSNKLNPWQLVVNKISTRQVAVNKISQWPLVANKLNPWQLVVKIVIVTNKLIVKIVRVQLTQTGKITAKCITYHTSKYHSQLLQSFSRHRHITAATPLITIIPLITCYQSTVSELDIPQCTRHHSFRLFLVGAVIIRLVLAVIISILSSTVPWCMGMLLVIFLSIPRLEEGQMRQHLFTKSGDSIAQFNQVFSYFVN